MVTVMAVGVAVGTGGTVWPGARCAGAAEDVQVRAKRIRSEVMRVALTGRNRRKVQGPLDRQGKRLVVRCTALYGGIVAMARGNK